MCSSDLQYVPRLSLVLSLAWSLAEEFLLRQILLIQVLARLLRLMLVIESAKGTDIQLPHGPGTQHMSLSTER